MEFSVDCCNNMGSDEARFCGIRRGVLQELLEDDRVLDALVGSLGVPGKANVLRGLVKNRS